MKKLFSLLAALLLSGCASVPPLALHVPGLERSELVRLSDLRPPAEKQSEVFSVLVTSDAYAIYRIADTVTVPSPVRLLQHRAHEVLRGQAEPMELKVHHFVVYRNLQSQLRRGALAVGLGGAVGGLVASANNGWVSAPSGAISAVVDRSAFDELGTSEFKRALYTERENPGRASVHVIYIDTEVGGKRVMTRTMAPLQAPAGENSLATAMQTALETAIKFHLAQY